MSAPERPDLSALSDAAIAELVDAGLATLTGREGDRPQSPDDPEREAVLDEREAGLERACDAWDEIRDNYREVPA